jgi:glutamate synthase domain-containing protein 3
VWLVTRDHDLYTAAIIRIACESSGPVNRSKADIDELKALISEHVSETGSERGQTILDNL